MDNGQSIFNEQSTMNNE